MNRVLAAAIVGVTVGAAGTFAVLDHNLITAASQNQTVIRDLGNVPKITDTVAALHREDRYENLHSIEQILALPTNFAQTEALYVLAGRSDSGSVQNLIYEANRIADPADRDGALATLFSRLTELDPPSALAMSRTDLLSNNKDVESTVWRSWGKHDLDGALLAAKAQSTSGQRNRAAQALFSAFGYLGNDTTARIEETLDIRPDRMSRNRFLYDLADRSPADAIKYVSNISSGRDQRDSLSVLAHHLRRNDPKRAASYADLFSDAILRQSYLSIVASTMAAAEPEAVLDQLLTTALSRPERNQIYGAMRELAARDVDRAIQYLEQVSSTQDRQILGSMIIEELARQDPMRALDWAREKDRGDYPKLLTQVLSRIASSEPQLAMEEAISIQHASRRNQAISNVVQTVARNDPALAAEFVNQIPNQQDRESATTRMILSWAQTDPEAAVNWVMTNDKINGTTVLERAGMWLVRTDIDAAIRMLPKLDDNNAAAWRQQIAQTLASERSATDAQNFISQFEGSNGFDKLQAAVATGVAKNDAFLAKQLADQLPRGADRDSAYSQLITEHANTNPAEAAAWLASISDAQYRSSATFGLMRVWYSQDPDAADRWANNLRRGAQRDDAIVGLASNWQEMTPSRRLLIDSIGDSEKQIQAQIAQIRIVARIDWQKAQTMLAETDMRSIDRQRIQMMIDHYRNR